MRREGREKEEEEETHVPTVRKSRRYCPGCEKNLLELCHEYVQQERAVSQN